MGLIEDLTPLNLAEERTKFFADPTYNPQFRYARDLSESNLTQWGIPKTELAEYCQHMLEVVKKQAGPKTKKQWVSTQAVQAKIDEFNSYYQLSSPVRLEFNPNLITQCRITRALVEFKIPITYNEEQLAGVIRHELETHYLRIHNHALQTWEKVSDVPDHFRRTEEGLAGSHSHLFTHRYMRKTFRTYLATWLSQRYSFAETVSLLKSYWVSDTMAWLHTVRAKRGLTDTSQPGGQTKDICYLEGYLQIWNWLKDPDHDPHDLYLGRIALEDLKRLKPTATTKGLLYPRFFDDMAAYRESMHQIGILNQFDQVAEVVHV